MFHWLEFTDWENACRLLNYQLGRKVENKHFNTFSMNAYNKILTEEIKKEIESKNFFNHFIKTGYIISDEEKVYSNHYPQPKGVLKYRKWIFLSLHMRLLYYAIGLHFARIISLDSIERVQARYGGNIQTFEDGKLQLKPSSVYYRKSYSSFYKKARIRASDKFIQKIDPSLDSCVIRLDIENFFEHIDIDKLFTQGFAFENDIPQNKRLSVKLFLQLLNQNHVGLPQTCNDVVAGYISCLYLRKFDEKLSFYLKSLSSQQGIYKFSVERYCDDTHIFIYFLKGQEEAFVKQVAKKVIDWCKFSYWDTYQLRLNNKSIYYHLNNEDERKKYQLSLKVTSQHEDFFNLENKPYDFKKWLKKFNISLLKYVEADLYNPKDDFGAGDTETLKTIYDKRFNATLSELLSLFLMPELKEGEQISVSIETMKSHFIIDNQEMIDSDPTKVIIPVTSDAIAALVATFTEDFNNIHQSIEKLDLTHLIYQPRVFSILAPFYPKIGSLLLEASSLDCAISYEWALSHFALEDFEQKSAFEKKFRETRFANTKVSSSGLKHLVMLNEDQHKELSYLSYFTCLRRFAESRRNYNEAVNYLNSELCILLQMSGWETSKLKEGKKENKKQVIPDSLRQFKVIKENETSCLSKLNAQRNRTDLSHNCWNYPEVGEPARVVTKEEYYDLKEGVFSEIQSIQNALGVTKTSLPKSTLQQAITSALVGLPVG
jgi:hypothetical protein